VASDGMSEKASSPNLEILQLIGILMRQSTISCHLIRLAVLLANLGFSYPAQLRLTLHSYSSVLVLNIRREKLLGDIHRQLCSELRLMLSYHKLGSRVGNLTLLSDYLGFYLDKSEYIFLLSLTLVPLSDLLLLTPKLCDTT
jgi:hypothetical protein